MQKSHVGCRSGTNLSKTCICCEQYEINDCHAGAYMEMID